MTETVEASSRSRRLQSAPGTDAAATTATRRRKAGGGLEGMLLPELKQLAGTLGIKGTGALRKGQLIEAIKAAQTGGGRRARARSTVEPADPGRGGRRGGRRPRPRLERERRQPPDPRRRRRRSAVQSRCGPPKQPLRP